MRALNPVPLSLGEWLRRHERRLALAWLALVALLVLVFALPATRDRLLGALEGASNRWDERWPRRIEHARRLLAAQQFDEAAAYLERLDRVYPAPSSEHARDRERQLLLRLLAQAYEGAGSNTRAMAVYDRLIAYAPQDYQNQFLRGQAAERMLSGWAIAPEARDAYAAVLALFPLHLPSVRGYIGYYADRGEFGPVAEAYASYLDAWYVQLVRFVAGDTTLWVAVPVDGRAHPVVLTLPKPRAESLLIDTRGYAFAVDSISATPARAVGAPGAAPIIMAAASARPVALTAGDNGAWLPTDTTASLSYTLPAAAAGFQDLRLVMRMFKPMDRPLWDISARAFHNLLNDAGRDSAAARTVTFRRAAEADAVLQRQGWYREGTASLETVP